MIVALILINALTLGLETFSSNAGQAGHVLHLIDQVLLRVFVLELLLKLVGHGRRFF